MSDPSRSERWWPNFRRTFAYLRPHRRPLIIGLLAALGVSVFYTVSISSVIPVIKVFFADHESLADWLRRSETERRLGVVLPADVPDQPAGLLIEHVRPGSPNAGVLAAGDRIQGAGADQPGSYALMARFAAAPQAELTGFRIVRLDGTTHTADVRLLPQRTGWPALERIVTALPYGQSPRDRLWTLAAVMVLLVVVSILGGVCRFLNEGLVAMAVQRAMHDLRTSLADHVLRLPMHWHASQPPGDTLGRFANDIGKVEVGLSTLFGKTVREPLKAIGVLALTLAIDWRLLAVALLGLPVGALVIRKLGRMVKHAQKRASESWGRLLDHLGERLSGIRVVKAYNMEPAENRRFEQEDGRLTRAQTHIELVDAATNPALEVLAMIAVAGLVIYGGTRVFAGQLEPHLFSAAVICLGAVFDPVRKMGNVNNRMQAADAAAGRLFELLDLPTEPDVDTPPAAPSAANFRDRIELRNVCFAYPGHPRRLVLEDVSVTVRRGQVVALVGPNGSGKTTLVSLLLRFYEPTAGSILIDGRDIATLPLHELRALFGLVTQDAVIFSDTTRANIAYGAPDAADETVAAAARTAHTDDFIAQLRGQDNGHAATGFDAPITSRTLSGGQKQRIALARAILRDPPILIFDEATSQIDSESERKIQEAMEDVLRNRTSIIIAHRFSTIRRADMIVVLNDGRVVACGSHEELSESCPFYVTLCETQFARG